MILCFPNPPFYHLSIRLNVYSVNCPLDQTHFRPNVELDFSHTRKRSLQANCVRILSRNIQSILTQKSNQCFQQESIKIHYAKFCQDPIHYSIIIVSKVRQHTEHHDNISMNKTSFESLMVVYTTEFYPRIKTRHDIH